MDETEEGQKLVLEFRREFLLEDALRHAAKKKFDPTKTLKVMCVIYTTIYTYILGQSARIYMYKLCIYSY